MIDDQLARRNPFPAEAVATFGRDYPTCDKLAYMMTAMGELDDYLLAYLRDENRYGGVIGLRGAYGAGKTHVLTWLGAKSANTKTINSTVIYGKCDSGRIFDLYRQIMGQLERARIIELIQLSLLKLARQKVSAVKVTESLIERLETAGGLQILQNEGNLDLDQLRLRLINELDSSSAGTNEMARILLDIPDPKLGNEAYAWLRGDETVNPDVLGTSYSLGVVAREGKADAELNAISAIELIAALHRIADVPFVLLIDQLEILLREATGDSLNTLGSLLKKFVEQITRQFGMTFIAGLPEAWAKLPQDVAARFRRREQIVVGALSSDEINLLLESYTGEVDFKYVFTPLAVDEICRLSGGNPREALRIGFHAFEATGGVVSQADEGILLRSAKDSGSINDRAQLALSAAESVFNELGRTAFRLSAGRYIVDCALLNAEGEVVTALLIAKATDAIDEIEVARSVADVQAYLQENWPLASLVVATVGYSSSEIRRLLGAVVTIQFDDNGFESRLRALALIALRTRAPVTRTISEDDKRGKKLDESLVAFSQRLELLEMGRRKELEQIQERFSQIGETLSAPAQATRHLETKREVMEALSLLADRLSAGDSEGERKLVQSVLVANETYLQNGPISELSELYLDVLMIGRHSGVNLHAERTDLLAIMRKALRDEPQIPSVLRDSRIFGAILSVDFLAFVYTGSASVEHARMFVVNPQQWLYLPRPTDFISALPFVFLVFAFIFFYAWVYFQFKGAVRSRRYHSIVETTRYQIKRQSRDEDRISMHYPQAR